MKKNTGKKESKDIQENVVTLDATGRPVGRLATEVASIVRGKTSASFAPNLIPAVSVIIEHIEKMKVTEKKLSENFYYRTSGYPGGLKKKSWKKLYEKSPQALFLKVIQNMLPRNSLRTALLKKISFK